MENDNMTLWNKVKHPDEAFVDQHPTKAYLLTIKAHYLIRVATEIWGPMGAGWGTSNERYTVISPAKHGSVVLYQATLWYGEEKAGNSLCIHADTTTHVQSGKAAGDYDDDWAKKVATEALSKGLSYLGFGAEIYLGEWDDKKGGSKPPPPRRGSQGTPPPRQEDRAEQTPEQALERSKLLEQSAKLVADIHAKSKAAPDAIVADATRFEKEGRKYYKTSLEAIPPAKRDGNNKWLSTTYGNLKKRLADLEKADEDFNDGDGPPF